MKLLKTLLPTAQPDAENVCQREICSPFPFCLRAHLGAVALEIKNLRSPTATVQGNKHGMKKPLNNGWWRP